MTIRSVAIYLFPDIEVLDFAGPYEVFTTASRVFKRRNPSSDPPFHVFTVAQQLAPVKARAGLVVQPDFAFASAPPVDLLVVPGGVVDAELNKTEVDEGAVVTSAGIAAGIDMSLHMVARFASPALASLTARQMDVPYRGDAEACA